MNEPKTDSWWANIDDEEEEYDDENGQNRKFVQPFHSGKVQNETN
jgi:hypothetical protein